MVFLKGGVWVGKLFFPKKSFPTQEKNKNKKNNNTNIYIL